MYEYEMKGTLHRLPFDNRRKQVPAYVSFLFDITSERREKKVYLLVGSEVPTLARVHMAASKWEGSESFAKLQCVVDEIDGVEVPEEIKKDRIVALETVGSPTQEEQASVLRQALARSNLVGRTILAEDVEGHLRVAALRRRLKRSLA